MCTYVNLEQKLKIGVKNPSFSLQIPFFFICLCTLVPWELYHDIWRIIFVLVVFHLIIISMRPNHNNFLLDGRGAEVWIALYKCAKGPPMFAFWYHKKLIWWGPTTTFCTIPPVLLIAQPLVLCTIFTCNDSLASPRLDVLYGIVTIVIRC